MVRVSLGLRLELGLGKAWVRVVNMFGVMVMDRVTTTQNLNFDPNTQNEIVEGHP